MRHVLAVALVMAGATSAGATDQAVLDRGRRVAEGYCGACHATGPQGGSPHRIVIPFRDLHQRRPLEMLDDALKTGVIAGHDEMPMFELGAENVAALVAYLESLWPATARQSGVANPAVTPSPGSK